MNYAVDFWKDFIGHLQDRFEDPALLICIQARSPEEH